MHNYTFISIVVKVGKMNNLSLGNFGFVYSVTFFITDAEMLPNSFMLLTSSIFSYRKSNNMFVKRHRLL